MEKESNYSSSRLGDARRQEIADAALRVICEVGVNGLTHRRVAAQAEMPLGSTTYYFATLDDILGAAFDLAMARDMAQLSAWVESLPAGCDLPAELTRLVLRLTSEEKDSVYVNFELVLAAARRPELHRKAHAWATHLARLFIPYVSKEAAEAIAVVYDGTLLRQTITGSIGSIDEVSESFARACKDERYFRRPATATETSQ